MTAPRVVSIVCDLCGAAEVGALYREERRWLYMPATHSTGSGENMLSGIWQMRFPPEPDDQQVRVWCERDHGWLTFAAGEMMSAARRHPPGRAPAVVRATRPRS